MSPANPIALLITLGIFLHFSHCHISALLTSILSNIDTVVTSLVFQNLIFLLTSIHHSGKANAVFVLEIVIDGH